MNSQADVPVLGFLKYKGALVEKGYLDAKTSARALTGLDLTLRYLVTQKNPDLSNISFEIPVKIQQGSWEALIPQTVGEWIVTGLGVAAVTYAKTAAGKLAENDFRDKSITDAFRHAFHAIQWLMRIGKHLGSFTHRKLTSIKWSEDRKLAGIPNENQEYLYVPIDIFKIYIACPSNLLSDMASVVEVERELSVGILENGKTEEVGITNREKYIFFIEEPENNKILFPELAHGMHVELEGVVTRGNEVTNSIGFRYNEHILACHPKEGSIVRFKEHLFLSCKIIGTITRESEEGTFDELRPKIIFDNLLILKSVENGPDLFEHE